MIIEIRDRVIPDHPSCEPCTGRPACKKRPDVVVHPLTREMDQDRATEFLEIICPDHHAQQAERILVCDLDEVWALFEQYSSDDRILHHVLPWHNDAVTAVEERRIVGGNVIYPCVLVYIFHRLGFTGDDKPDMATMTPCGG